MDDEGIASEPTTFARALDAFKENGSTVLLVGSDAAAAHERVCERLLGESAARARYRVFVSIGDGVGSHPEATGADGPVRAIEYARVVDGRTEDPLGALSAALIETIDDVDREAGGLAPGQLRVCVDSALPLVDAHGDEGSFRALHAITSRITRANGIGHVHLPVDRGDGAAPLLDPLFDAVVEVRTTGAGHEHRWHLRDERATTDWLALDR